MSKETTSWQSQRLGREARLARWGAVGTPVLVFPTAGGDAEEIERFHLIEALGPLLEEGRVKLYSVDSVAGKSWLSEDSSAASGAALQNRYDDFLYHEVLPAIRADCRSPDIEILTAGASIGAYNALAFLCRHPDAVAYAICMSGTYDLSRFLHGSPTSDFYYCSPLQFLPDLDEHGGHLATLRGRSVLLAHGQGRWEDPDQSWRVADALGARGVPNRVEAWGPEWDHDWPTWRAMLPVYLEEWRR